MGYWLWKIMVMTQNDESVKSLQKIELFHSVVANLMNEYSNGCPHSGTSTSFRKWLQLSVIVKLYQDNGVKG